MRPSSRQRVAVFFDEGFGETLPLLREPIARLAEEGLAVDLLCRRQWSWTPIDGVELLELSRNDPQQSRRSVATVLGRAARGRYAVIIATPVWALLLADVIGRATRTPVVTLSDRLYTPDDYGTGAAPRRAMYRAQRRSAFTIIPDLARVPPLVRDAPQLRDHAFVELPNVVAGDPDLDDPARLRQRLGLPVEDTLVLFAGTIWAGMGLSECVAAVPLMPPATTLVVQSIAPFDPVVAELGALVANRYPLVFRPTRLPYREADALFAACDVGLVFYPAAGPNFAFCGKASGKLGRFLRVGRPVIVDRRGGLEWVAEYGAGEVAETPAEIGAAITRIRSDPARYQERARACFEEHFRFEAYWPGVRDALDRVMR